MRYYRLPPGAGLGALALLALFLFALVFVPARLAGEAFERLGLTMLQGLAVLAAMLLWRTRAFTVFVSRRLVPDRAQATLQEAFLRMQGMEMGPQPTGELVRQRVQLGLGGCVVPLCLCVYFALRLPPEAWAWVAGGSAVVAGACFAAMRRQPGRGVEVPVFVAPVATLAATLLFSGREWAPQAAYLCAVLGTLGGTGLLPLALPRLRAGLDQPRVVIGGPGVFGGLFLATLAAGLFS